MADESLKGKVALVTGANKGIGLEIARQLAQKGSTVLVGARSAERGQEAAQTLKSEGLNARFVLLDITDQKSIDQAAQTVQADFGKLDILVNNAGIAVDRNPVSETEMDVLRRTFDTNFFGTFAVTKAFLPLVRKADAGRIVNMSSGLGSLTQMGDKESPYYQVNPFAYNSSKTAVNALTVLLANELKDTKVKVNAADPGYVATDLNGNSGPRTVEQGATAPVRLAMLPADGPTGGYFDENGAVPW